MYAAFGPCHSEYFISEFSNTFMSHHTDIILIKLEVSSPIVDVENTSRFLLPRWLCSRSYTTSLY